MQVFQTIAQLKANAGVADNAAQVLGYHIAGDGGGGDFYWDATSLDPDNNGTIFALSAGGTGRWKRIYSEAINVKWFGTDNVNDSVPFAGALYFCKKNGIDLVIPSGTYVTSIVLDWCVQESTFNELSGEPSYNPADPTQGTEIGRAFNIRGEANTVITGDLILRRCRDMEVSNITCQGNFIAVACELLRFVKIESKKTASLAYYSDDFTDIAMKKKYFLALPPLEPGQLISDGGCYWLSFADCFFEKGFVIGGKDVVQHNVIGFTNCNFNGARINDVITAPPYLNHHGAGLYVEMLEGHSDGITLTNCDLSYSDFPLYVRTNTCAVTMTGCYYEGCAHDFFTRDGLTSSDKTATIINGFDFDRASNQRIELRASRWALSGSRSSSDNYARLMIPGYGGEISILNEGDGKRIGSIVNRIGTPGNYGETIGYTSNSEEFEQKQATSMGLRYYQNYNTYGLYKRVTIPNGDTTQVSLIQVVTDPEEPAAELYGNAHIKLVVVGGVQGNSADKPIVYEGWAELDSTGNWSIPQLISGNLTGGRILASFSAAGNNTLVCNISKPLDNAGYFKGTIHLEVTVDVSKDTNGIVGWRIE